MKEDKVVEMYESDFIKIQKEKEENILKGKYILNPLWTKKDS